MDAETTDFNHWADTAHRQFAKANRMASKLSEQNLLYIELLALGEIATSDMRDMTEGFLECEQDETFIHLMTAAETAPYTELAEHEKRLRSLGGEDAAESDAEQIQRWRQESRVISRIIPEIRALLQEFISDHEAELVEMTQESSNSEQTEAEAEYQRVERLYEAAGKSWPIPLLLSKARIKDLAPETINQDIGDEIIEVDSFPGESRPLTKRQIAERVHRKYPESILKDASEFLALLLAEEPKHIFTSDELGEILYSRDQNEQQRRSKISALISSYELGKVRIIGGVLQEHGLVFQRGMRSSFHKDTGKKIGRSRPVFRAVPISEADEQERIVHSGQSLDWVTDSWHTVVYAPSSEN